MKNTDNLGEFEWEELFRQEDEKIHKYMKELSKYIDLPGEDQITMEEDLQQEKLLYLDLEDYDNDDSSCDWLETKDAPSIEKIIKVSRNCLLIQNALLSGQEKNLAFKSLTIIAITTGRMIAAVLSEKNNPNLALAHYKRLRAELSSAEALMRKIVKLKPELMKVIGEQISSLAEISEIASDKIFELRKKTAAHP